MKTVTAIEMANDNQIYRVSLGKELSIIEDEGDFIITNTGDADGELCRHDLDQCQSRLVEFAIDDDFIVSGYGIHSGRKFWQLPDEIKQEVIAAACGGTQFK